MPIIALALLPALLHWPILLLPVHIVLLELLIDPACSIVFEAEPAARDIMLRPPRPLAASPFAAGNIGLALAQGSGIGLILLARHFLLQRLGWADTDLRVSVFAALVLALFLLILANRDLKQAASRSLGSNNPWLLRLFLGVSLLLAAVLTIPFLRDIMGFGLMSSVLPLLASVALALTCGLWLQMLRSANNRWLHLARTA